MAGGGDTEAVIAARFTPEKGSSTLDRERLESEAEWSYYNHGDCFTAVLKAF